MLKTKLLRRIPRDDIRRSAEEVMCKLPGFWKEFRRPQLERVCDELSWVYVENGVIVDLGGGNGFHASILSNLGMRAVCVDFFKTRAKGNFDDQFYEHDLEAERISRELGVEFIHTDLLEWNPPYGLNSIDAVMTFDNIEHLHHSPRRLYKKMVEVLKPGGLFLIGAPNAANLLKRFRVPLGMNIFAYLEHWYMHENFIGHVREPILSDLHFIAKDIGLSCVRKVGRNWLGLYRVPKILLKPARMFSSVMEFCPSLCSDIYVLGTKD